jgi:hypothetical protein
MEVEDASIHTQKKNWILTYVSSTGEQISIQMLKDLGKLDADECHLTSDRVMSYVYIHLLKRARQPAMMRFMENARLRHGITLSEIYGYESIASPAHANEPTSIQNHIAFRMLVKHANEKNASFKPCTDGEPILSRGVLFKAVSIDPVQPQADLKRQTKSQLIKYIMKLEKVQEESKDLKEGLENLSQFYQTAVDERSRLRLENAEQRKTIQTLQERLRITSSI